MPHNNDNEPMFFPQEPFKKEVIEAFESSNIGDGGYEATGDVARENEHSLYIQHSQKEREAFLRKCGIDPERFFNS